MTTSTLEATFARWKNALGAADLTTFYALMDDAMVIFDEDTPWRFSNADFADHIAFHIPMWESFQWVPRE